MSTCETVQIQTEPSKDNPTGVVIINKSDLTPEHKLVGAEPAKKPTAKAEKAEAAPVPASAEAAPWAKPKE